jgi:hypothetical protein
MREDEGLLSIFGKSAVLVCLILIGWIGKICHHLYMKRKLSWVWAIASLGMVFFVGVMTYFWSIRHYPEETVYLVPMASLISDKIMLAFFSLDWKGFAHDVLKHFFGQK